MGRAVYDPKHLLDTDAEQNIGNSTTLIPQDGNGNAGGTTTPETNPPRILMLNGPSKTAQTTSIVFTASRIVGNENANPGYAGPVTGIVEFGNGGRFTKVEFDVPLGPFLGSFQGALSNTEPQDGGTIVTVPTGVLRAYARYDNRLIQPTLGTPGAMAQKLGVPLVGPGGPVSPVAVGYAAPAEPVLVKIMAAYYTRRPAKLYKTQFCYVSAPGVPPQVVPQTDVGLYCVPAFAKSVRVLRSPIGSAMRVELFDGLYTSPTPSPLDVADVPANANPEIPIVGHETIIRVSSATPADAVYQLALCYEIGL